MRIVLIANPRSGTAPPPEQLEQLLAATGASVRVVAIDELTADGAEGLDGDGVAAALRRIGAPDRIVVAGGDGSVGLAAQLAAAAEVPLAVVAVGTANDFARAKDLPLDLEEACALARDPQARTCHAELALAGLRPFVNAASTGLSVKAADAAKPFKRRLGPLAYAIGAVRAAAAASPLRCAVVCDGEQRFAGRAWQVVVAATGAFGGGSEIGGTDPHDGLLDVAVVPAGSRVGLVRRAYGMRTGSLTAQDDVAHERGMTVELELEDDRAQFNVDGELCDCLPARFTLRPGGFEMLCR